MSKRFTRVLVALVLLVAVAFLIGLARGEEHRVASRIVLHRAPTDVYNTLADFERWPEWSTAVQSAKPYPDRDGKEVWVLVRDGDELICVIEDEQPPTRLVTRVPEDAGAGFHGTWTYELTPGGGGVELVITEHGFVPNPFMRFLSLVLFNEHSAIMEVQLDLAKKFGEPAEPEKVEPGG